MAHEYKGFGTRAIHHGVDPDPSSGAVITPISLSTTFQQSSPGVHLGYDYSRSGNPTRAAFEKNIAAAENGKYGLAFSSGLAATTTVTHTLRAGDHVVCMDDVYGGTRRYFSRIAARLGLEFSYTDFSKPGALESAITPKTKLVWLESPTNPLLKITDIVEVAKVTKKHNLVFVVDNTFMSPYFQNPLDLGADIVVHSVTKYISGHSDVVMGVVVTNNDKLYEDLKFLQNGIGAVPSPFDCFLALRSMKTLHIRMREHEKSATTVAKFLSSHPLVERVVYPGLPSHPQHELAKKQMKGFGGMITFFIKGGIDESRKLLENIKIPALAESLGGVESLIELPSVMTHASVPAEERVKLGISDSLIRLSVGLEDIDDLIADLDQALKSIAPK
jgi:cystathionine gamma-lyase